MDIGKLAESLTDERCGLFFLAGLDEAGPAGGQPILTVHAAEGTVGPEQQRFILTGVAASHPGMDVRIRLHSTPELYARDSLEAFAATFDHDHIVADPTGAFARVSKLLSLARAIRAEAGDAITRIFWRSDDSSLVVLAAPAAGAPGNPEGSGQLRDRIDRLIERQACPELRKAIASVRVCDAVPAGRYSAVDAASRVVPAVERKAAAGGRGLIRMLARIPGIAAVIGLGTLSVAHARTPAIAEHGEMYLPGIAGLVGLTTLGENSYGFRNRYQAMGGLRLYFGDTGALSGSAFMPGSLRLEDPLPGDPGADAAQESWPSMPKPPRLASND